MWEGLGTNGWVVWVCFAEVGGGRNCDGVCFAACTKFGLGWIEPTHSSDKSSLNSS